MASRDEGCLIIARLPSISLFDGQVPQNNVFVMSMRVAAVAAAVAAAAWGWDHPVASTVRPNQLCYTSSLPPHFNSEDTQEEETLKMMGIVFMFKKEKKETGFDFF